MKTLIVIFVLFTVGCSSTPPAKDSGKMATHYTYLVDDTTSPSWLLKSNRVASYICGSAEYDLTVEKLPHYKAEVSVSCSE